MDETRERDFFLKNKYVFQFWTDTNPLTENRIRNLLNFESKTRMKNILVNTENLNDFIVPYHPLHKAFPYLSAVHKSDYLRPYFAFFYGGGYMDIKNCWSSWESSWNDLVTCKDKSILMNSHPNPDKGCVPVELSEEIKNNYYRIPYISIFLSKQFNPVMYDWLIEIEKLLDEKFDELVKHPATDLYDYKNRDGYSLYPIEWNEIGARIFHRVYYERCIYSSNPGKSLFTMPFLDRVTIFYR